MDHITTGRNNEERAARFLEASGHIILERNWRKDRREVDIISETQEYIVITEVKTMIPGSCDRPQDIVNRKKQQHIIRTAEVYVWEKRLAKPVRFDLILIYENRDGFRIEQITDAFYPGF